MKAKHPYLCRLSSKYRRTEQVLHFPSAAPIIKQKALFRERLPSPLERHVTQYYENPPEDPNSCELCEHPIHQDEGESIVDRSDPELEDDQFVYFVRPKTHS